MILGNRQHSPGTCNHLPLFITQLTPHGLTFRLLNDFQVKGIIHMVITRLELHEINCSSQNNIKTIGLTCDSISIN